MRVIFIRNYRGKTMIAGILAILWLIMYLISEFTFHSSLLLKVTINDSLEFSHPLSVSIEDIYYNENHENNIVQTSSMVKRPEPQKFSTYTSLQGKFSFTYPSYIALSKQSFEGSDIIYHIDLLNKAKRSHGFVQVWNLPYSLKDFLDTSLKTAQGSFADFEYKSVTVNGINGYLWSYKTGQEGNSFYGNEVFLQKNDKMYRISYFVPLDQWDKSQQDLFWGIVNSFKTN